MNRNFTAFCAAMLAFAILLVICGGFIADSKKFALAEEAEKTVYLTFDDGPSDRVTPKILDVLAEEKVKATFFIIGKNVETRKNLIKREFDEGHTVAVHSYTHKYKEIYSSAESLIKDIDACNEVIKSVTGKYSSVYRFPGGSYGLSQKFISAVTAHGLRYVDWNASTRDAEILNATPAQLLKAAVTTSASSNYIVLLAHDSTSKSATAEALRDIIKHYKDNGYVFKAF
ncbi:MAG: polysaccharide deacetylase [Clostridia bacterium]|nr:polysaccharide deacetylase [Clostridia bacterium]